MVFGVVSWFLQWFRGADHETTVEIKNNNEFSSFPNKASVGFPTNPHNLSLHNSSTTRDAAGPVRAPMKPFVFVCFMKDFEFLISSRDPVI